MRSDRPRLPAFRFSAAHVFSLATWRDVVFHVLKYRLLGLTAGIAYPTLLGLLLGSLALLLATGLMPAGWRIGLGAPLSQVLPLAPLTDFATWAEGMPPSQRRQWLVVVGLLAWWAGAGAMQGLLRALDLIHQIPLSQRRLSWRSRFLALALALALGVLAGISLNLAYAGSGTLHQAQQAGASFEWWVAALRRLLYWLLALGLLAATFVTFYRLGPSRWVRGTPLLPGAVLTAGLWVGTLVIWQRADGAVQAYQTTFGTLGVLIVLMAWIYAGVFTVLLGDQFNVSVGRQRALRPAFTPRPNPGIPPSFDSFRIRKRDDRFP